MRLIDADMLLDEIGKLKKSPWYNNSYSGERIIRKEAVEIVEDLCIKEAPTVDAVPISVIEDIKAKFRQIDATCVYKLFSADETIGIIDKYISGKE